MLVASQKVMGASLLEDTEDFLAIAEDSPGELEDSQVDKEDLVAL